MSFIGIGIAVGGAGALGGALISSSAANNAANTQANAANNAAQLQYQTGQNTLNFEEQQYANSQGQIAPYLNTGYQSLADLQYLMGQRPSFGGSTTSQGGGLGIVPGGIGNPNGGGSGPPRAINPRSISAAGDLGTSSTALGPYMQAGGVGPLSTTSPTTAGNPAGVTPDTNLGAYGSLAQGFTAPSLDNTTDPGYLARLNLGEQALTNSAAAKGGLLSGGTLRDLNSYAQDYASNEYGNVYNRAFNTFETNQANTYNRLANMAGLGQTALNTSVNAGGNAAGQVGNTLLSTGSQIGNDITNAGAARASGYVGSANALSGALGGVPSNILSMLYLNQLSNNQAANQTPYTLPAYDPTSVG